MAKIRGPLFSEDARGNYAKGAIQFRSGIRGTHAYRPKDPKTINQAAPTQKQTKVRSAYHTILEEWRAFDEQTKAQLDAEAIASGESITGWNLYFKSRITAVLNAPDLPAPNTYAPPDGEDIIFPGTVWAADTNYTPPTGGNITFG